MTGRSRLLVTVAAVFGVALVPSTEMVGVGNIGVGLQSAHAEETVDEKNFQVKYFDINAGRIAFAFINEKVKDIYVLDFKDLSVEPVVTSPGDDEAPMFSPDGRKLLFQSTMTGRPKIFIANSDGSDVQQVTTGDGDDENPSWSPDGKKVVFQSTRGGQGSDIYIINADGTGLKALTSTRKKNVGPRWSPRGDEMLYASNTEWPGWDIIVHNLKTNTAKVMTKGLASYTRPYWHPDGSGFLFSYGSGDDTNIYQAIKGKTVPAPIAQKVGKQLDPVFDDTARRIFFVGEAIPGQGNFQLYMYDSRIPPVDAKGEPTKSIVQILEVKVGAIRYPSWTALPSVESLVKEQKRKLAHQSDGGSAEAPKAP